ncbi:MAG: hypothetical protein IPG34_06590 [Rhodocyclaceae bacterium]|nr:hypothetical protein [Rhodocyclaceae bacterium]
MTRSASRFFVLLLTALWLPVQGLALLVMPLSMLTSTAAVAAVAADVTTLDSMPRALMGPAMSRARQPMKRARRLVSTARSVSMAVPATPPKTLPPANGWPHIRCCSLAL